MPLRLRFTNLVSIDLDSALHVISGSTLVRLYQNEITEVLVRFGPKNNSNIKLILGSLFLSAFIAYFNSFVLCLVFTKESCNKFS